MADLPCPTCGSPLTFIDQYQRFYCHRCLAYAPEGYGDRGGQPCPTCGGILSYVRQYGRMYCYRCNSYPAEPSATEVTTEAPVAPQTPSTPETSAESPATPGSATPAPVSAPQPSESSPVAAPAEPTPPAATEPAPEAHGESAEGTSESSQETPPSVPEAPPAESTPEATSKPEEAAPPPPSKEMQILAASKPAALRVKLFALKKPELMDLCRIYNLEATGTKEEIQQRLLAYLHDLESEGEPQETVPPVAEAPASEAPAYSTAPMTEAPQETTTGAGSAQAVSAAVVEEIPPQAAPAPVAAPSPVVVAPAPVTVEAPHVVSKAEHPCPTCGRELTYISQYNRWYCYYCQRYAPAAVRARNACPTCGATMRWIDQHHRWWCDACQKYASPDLPAPAGSAVAAAAVEHETAASVSRAVVVHRHGTPAGGAGLVGFGLALYIVYAFFAYLGAMMNIVTPSSITPEMLNLLQFFAFLFVAIGAIAGLYGMRDRS